MKKIRWKNKWNVIISLFLKQFQNPAKFDIDKYCTLCAKINYLMSHKNKYAIKNKRAISSTIKRLLLPLSKELGNMLYQ